MSDAITAEMRLIKAFYAKERGDMVVYEYKCNHCGRKFEMKQSIKDKPISRCIYCQKRSVKRLISGGNGIIFKGEGFYCTDNKKKT